MTQRFRTLLLCRMLVCVALLSFAAVLSAQTAEWKSYRYPTDGFRASYPTTPELSKDNVPTAAGSFEMRSYLGEDSSVALLIAVCDYGTKVQGVDPDAMLQGAEQGAMENVKGHVLRDKKIMLGAYHGMEFESENDTLHFSGRFYIVGSVLYETLVASPIETKYTDTMRFLDSFQLIARDAN